MHASSPERDPPQRILVVEDQFLVALDIAALLEGGGYGVVGPAATVSKALTLIEHEPIDAAVLDINLEDDLSYPIADMLRDRDTPFVFATGRNRAGVEPAYRDCAMLAKPVQKTLLLETIRDLIGDA